MKNTVTYTVLVVLLVLSLAVSAPFTSITPAEEDIAPRKSAGPQPTNKSIISPHGAKFFFRPEMKIDSPYEPYFGVLPIVAVDTSPTSPFYGNIYVVGISQIWPGRLSFTRSIDGGISFENVINPIIYNEYYGFELDPLRSGLAMEIDKTGKIYVVYSVYEAVAPRLCNLNIYMIKSSDGGLTWTHPVRVSHDAREWLSLNRTTGIAISPVTNTIVVLWVADSKLQPRDEKIVVRSFYSRSTDGGNTWSRPKRIVNMPNTPARSVTVDDRGRFYIVWKSPVNDFTSNINFSISYDDGTTFGPEKTAVGLVRGGWWHIIMKAREDGKIYLCWVDRATKNGVTLDRIMFTSSSNGGNFFSPPTEVTDKDAYHTNFPYMTVTNESIFIAWQDWREPGRLRAYFSYSTNGGLNFSKNIRVGYLQGENQVSSITTDGKNVYLTLMLIDDYHHTSGTYLIRGSFFPPPSNITFLSIPLTPGWNFISNPLDYEGIHLRNVLRSLFPKDNARISKPNFDVLRYYDAANNSWKNYYVNTPGFLNEVKNITNTMGFWIRITNKSALVKWELCGYAPVSTNITLKSGWNMIGFPSLVPKKVSDVFGSLGVQYKVETGERWSPSTYYLKFLRPDDYMQPGMGYWVWVDRDVIVTI